MAERRRSLAMLIATCAVILVAFSGVGYAYTAISVNEENNATANYITITQEDQSGVSAFTFGDVHLKYDTIVSQYVKDVYRLTDAVNLGIPQGDTRVYYGVHGELIHTLQLTGDLDQDSYEVQMWYTNIPDIRDWKAVFAYWPVGTDETQATKVLVEDITKPGALTLVKDGSGAINYNFRAYTSAPGGETDTPLPRSVILYGAPFVASCGDNDITVNVDGRTGLMGKGYHNYADTPEAQAEYEAKTVGADADFKIIRTTPVAWVKELRNLDYTEVYQLKSSITDNITVDGHAYKAVKFGSNSSYQVLRLSHANSSTYQNSYDVKVWYDPSTFGWVGTSSPKTMGDWKLILEYWTENEGSADSGHHYMVLKDGENSQNNTIILYPGTDHSVAYNMKLYLAVEGGVTDTPPPRNAVIRDGTIVFSCTI